MAKTRDEVTGLLLAGGRARRMDGRDKGLLALRGRPMAAWVLDQLAQQTRSVLISANRNAGSYADLGHEVIADRDAGFLGPLAGLATGLDRAETPWVVTAPCDSPFLAADYVGRLYDVALNSGSKVAVAHDGHRLQPVFSLVNVSCRSDLEIFLKEGGRKIDLWLDRQVWKSVDFSDWPDMFLNVNTPRELHDIEEMLDSGEF